MLSARQTAEGLSPVDSSRAVVLHVHLFKNAGTTIEQGLQSFFGNQWASFDRSRPGARVTQGDLNEFLSDEPSIAAISSHQLRPPFDEREGFVWLPLLFLRHPIDRIRSAYDFERLQDSITPSSRAAAMMSFARWIEYHREVPSSSQCRNFQTFALTTVRNERGAPMRREPIKRHLRSARKVVEALPAFGLVEQFDDSWQLICDWISCYHPGFRPEVQHANVLTPRSSTLETRLARLSESLGDSAFDRLLEDNEIDMMLYRWAEIRFQSLLAVRGQSPRDYSRQGPCAT